MTRFASLTRPALMSFAVLCLACAPEEQDEPATPIPLEDAAQALAEQQCAQTFGCECEAAEFYSDEAQCVSEARASYQASIDMVLADGGTWNAQCAGELVATQQAWACLGPNSALQAAPVFDAHYLCPIVKGSHAQGDACDWHPLGDSCAEGLTCLAGFCEISPEFPVGAGESCRFDYELLPCEAGTTCVYDSEAQEQLCAPVAVAGDPCTDGWCPGDQDLICEPESAICVAAPGEGESCMGNAVCGPGLYCDGGKDWTCTLKSELGGGCGADAVCPADSSCESNICVADPAYVCP